MRMYQEHNNQGPFETRPETPPLTPVSAKPTLSSQTSTGKSGYSRKFNRKWLATPSSTGAGSPMSKNEPTPKSPAMPPSPTSASIGSIPSNPNGGSARPVPPYSPPAHFTAPSHAEQCSQMANPHQHVAYPSHVESYYHQNFGEDGKSTNLNSYYTSTLLGPTAAHKATFQTSPSPQSSTSPPYGGEAYHRMPPGINPSPQASLQAGHVVQAIVPVAPTILEHPAVQTNTQKHNIQAGMRETSSKKLGKLKNNWFRRSRDGVT